MKHKGVFIVGGVCVALAGVAGWSLLLFLLLHYGLLFPNKAPDASGFAVRFGIIEIDPSRKPFLAQETTTIPMKLKETGFEYGVMIVPPDDKPFTYQMVFHFSSPPKMITGDGFQSNEPSATMRTQIGEGRGTTCDEYWFDPGDPTGDQSIDVYINGQLFKTIKYTVAAADDGGSGN